MPFCSTALIDSWISCSLSSSLSLSSLTRMLVRVLHGDLARLGAAAAELAENIAEIDGAHLRARHAGNFEHRHAAARLHLDLDFLVVEFAGAQLFAEALARRGTGTGADQGIEHALFGGELGLRLHVLAFAFAGERDGNLDQVAHDLLDVAADIADLGELGGFDFEERRGGQPREAPRDFGLADAGRADHQNVLRQHFLAQLFVELQAAPAVAQGDGDRALGVGLADDEAVEFGNDFARGKVGHSLFFLVIPGRREAPDPESQIRSQCLALDSGFAPSARPGHDNYPFKLSMVTLRLV